MMCDPEQPSSAGVKAATVPPLKDATNNNYAFLVHSQKSLTQNLPPKVDNKALARQKRRRTSPDDQKILEAEYQRNPKPDRATRADIVNRVTLGEKEVQIWFQNRRQNDRRRSKPLNPGDFKVPKPSDPDQDASNGNNPVNSESQATLLSKTFHGTDRRTSTDTRRANLSTSPDSSFGSETVVEHESTLSSQPPNSQETVISLQREELRDDVGKIEGQTGGSKEGGAMLITDELHIEPVSRKRSRSQPEAANTNKYSPPTSSTFIPPSLRISLSFDGEAVVRKEGESTPSPQKPLDAIRISMSADGEALIRTASEESPITKNRAPLLYNTRPVARGLRRSISAFPLGALKGTKEGQDPKPFGRSRDSRIWELHCDTDARTALLGSKGSLLSSTARTRKLSHRKSDLGHGRKALMPRTNLPNIVPLAEEPTGKRKKLSRAMSSLARLETGHKGLISKMEEGVMDCHTGDSDKENWIPGTQMSAARRVPSNKQKTRRVGLQKPNRLSNGQSAGYRPVAGSNKMQRGHRDVLLHPSPDNTQEGGDDVTGKFHGAPDEISQLSQDEDLDCIQGLLSLSQGAWR
ncbi:homeobox transcription factor [Histoplasma capsulatum G186AR]|nr:homeobox transcription factor [Histoplasma capsulatum]QSS68797.1 homeobox transcription factor [Histoplasma capsulatum G186AR]